jgi:hypothetical protein
MVLSPLRFVPYRESTTLPNVVVDGSPNGGTVLVLSHWPGLPTPADCAADTSAQMAFRYLDQGAGLHGDAAVVTNNHFDQDGLAGVYALTNPADALHRRELLEALACAGDFAVSTDRAAARLSMAVAALGDRARTPLDDIPTDYDEASALLYAHALELLPGWMTDPASCRSLWAEEDAELDAGIAAIESGSVTIEEDPEVDLAVVTLSPSGRSAGHRFVGRSFGGVHPMALHAATERSVILALDPVEGRHHLTCRYEGWVQFRSRPIRARVDLLPLAEQLTSAEGAGVRWVATPPSDLTPELLTAGDGPGSSLDPQALVGAVTDHLRAAPPAWNPYDVGQP